MISEEQGTEAVFMSDGKDGDDKKFGKKASSKQNSDGVKSGFDTLMSEIASIQKLNGNNVDLEKMRDDIKRRGVLKDPAIMRQEEALQASREIALRNEKQRVEFIKRTMVSGNIDANWTFDKLICDPANAKAISDARIFCQVHLVKPEPPSLFIISGAPGSGKSVLANAMAAFWLEESNKEPVFKDVCLITPAKLERTRYFNTNEAREERVQRQKDWERYCSTDLLVLDGLCENGKGLSNFMQGVLPELMRNRFDCGLSMILTVSLPAISYLPGAVGAQTFESFKLYEVVTSQLMGKSRRKQILFNGVPLE